MKFMKLLSIFILAILIVAGCGGKDDAKEDDKKKEDKAKVQNVESRKDEEKIRISEKAEHKVENLSEVRHSNVIVTDKNAYVAVILDDEPKGELREEVETRIADQVKSTDENIDHVYVSSNPDFVDRMGDFGDRIREGKPVKGLVDEFTEMVQRVFPNAR
ncbi:YhcN/YlaJ family sporulation lipoprotein [Mesobacillus maritimus]|uniref:YhcN/YlaJ family sporulation lipoprotein n=1 Tax=Mesobacillus maritimus TaxID=1643336 RepID=UPI00203DDCED|nr:YhcN/YlaJ family sporulation lipoprotein [Mesobacillus maritimus]MCM3585799.1 YhcN/YlaJ family sporulation lipoprotein [Mesobacillus maritimus]